MSYIVPKEKPRCFNCPFRTLDYCGLLTEHDCVTVNVNEMSVSEYCPLVEIPTPHGRLIDADEIEMPCLETTADQKWMEIAIKSTPTVIEAEGSETDA